MLCDLKKVKKLGFFDENFFLYWEDIDLMENLGIYEVAPEDFALCEYACTSKIETQKIVREALDLVRKETS